MKYIQAQKILNKYSICQALTLKQFRTLKKKCCFDEGHGSACRSNDSLWYLLFSTTFFTDHIKERRLLNTRLIASTNIYLKWPTSVLSYQGLTLGSHLDRPVLPLAKISQKWPIIFVNYQAHINFVRAIRRPGVPRHCLKWPAIICYLGHCYNLC